MGVFRMVDKHASGKKQLLERNPGTAHINSISSTVYGDRDMPSHRAHTVPHKHAIPNHDEKKWKHSSNDSSGTTEEQDKGYYARQDDSSNRLYKENIRRNKGNAKV